MVWWSWVLLELLLADFGLSKESLRNLLRAYLRDHAHYEPLLFNVVRLHSVRVNQDLPYI
jgi:hypothetical protein